MSEMPVQATGILRRFRRVWSWLMLGAFLAVVGSIAVVWLDGNYALEAAMDEADRLDPGWRLEELQRNRKSIPDHENSALTVEAAYALLPAAFPVWEHPGAWGQQYSTLGEAPNFAAQLDELPATTQLNNEQILVLRAELARAKPGLEASFKLAAQPTGRYEISYTPDIMSTLLDPIQRSRDVGKLLRLAALVYLHTQDLHGVDRSFRCLLNVSRSVGNEPGLVAQLVRLAHQELLMQVLERSLAQKEFDQRTLEAWQRELAKDADENLFLISMRGDRAVNDAFMQALQTGKGGLQAGLTEPALLWSFPGVMSKKRAAALSQMTQVVEIAKGPEKEQLARCSFFETCEYDGPGPVGAVLRSASRIVMAMHRIKALMRCGLTALAVERYRLQHGRWPETLDELTAGMLAEIPADPFDGAPLRICSVAEGIIVYSVGPDGNDDGGAVAPQNPLQAGSDIGIRVWQVKLRRQSPIPFRVENPPIP